MRPPFFIVGSVRSGTTLLRDILRYHPNLECPEETHFFRWCDPFGTMGFDMKYTKNPHLLKHRELDGFTDEEFSALFQKANSRKELSDLYGKEFLKKRHNPEGRWFDKTPQNIYGLLLMASLYPEASFVHIVRNPLNVVASLKIGKVMKIGTKGAINYWMESLAIIDAFKKVWPQRLHEMRYEDVLQNTEQELSRLMVFLGEDAKALVLPKNMIKPEKNKYKKELSDEIIASVKAQCAPFMTKYGYLN